ncbi:hypothetical protein Tco_1189545 [Tanacetum coccineum]
MNACTIRQFVQRILIRLSVRLSSSVEVALCKCSSTGRLLGAYNLEVATSRALLHIGDKTSGDARSWYMISEDAKSWVVIVLHIFTVILHNYPLFEILAQQLGFLQTYELTNIIVDIFEYHFQVCFDKGRWMVLENKVCTLGDLGFKTEVLIIKIET